MMLFRSFLHHHDETIRLQAQEEVFASALTVTRLCYEGREALRQLTCGTISMILLTCAVALASYSRAHKGKESARALEAKEAFDTLKASLRCMDRDDVNGPINSLHMKNSEAIRKLQAFLDPSSVTPKATSPISPTQLSPHHTSSLASSLYNATSSTSTPMEMDTNYGNNRYSSISSASQSPSSNPNSMVNSQAPQQVSTDYYCDPSSKASNPQSFYGQPPIMNQNIDYNFYNPDNYNPELEFGHLVDPFSEAFFAELMSMSEQNMTPDDWSRLLA
ncbi:hypothetical protein ABW20_dc0100459 [Dactylellina cionopaga]|nr:hypothetical protein ABW20_dc0100459 [Dactylellina cionopaga]